MTKNVTKTKRNCFKTEKHKVLLFTPFPYCEKKIIFIYIYLLVIGKWVSKWNFVLFDKKLVLQNFGDEIK